MKCEKCGKKHDGSFGSGRFCCRACANSRKKTLEERKRVSLALGGTGDVRIEIKKHPCKECGRLTMGKTGYCSRHYWYSEEYRAQQKLTRKAKYNASSFNKLSKRTQMKILRRMGLEECLRCGWKEGKCDLHHINGKSFDEMEDLTFLCPNCHRLVHEGKVKKEELKTLSAHIKKNWREYYYG